MHQGDKSRSYIIKIGSILNRLLISVFLERRHLRRHLEGCFSCESTRIFTSYDPQEIKRFVGQESLVETATTSCRQLVPGPWLRVPSVVQPLEAMCVMTLGNTAIPLTFGHKYGYE